MFGNKSNPNPPQSGAAAVTEQQVLAALGQVRDPELGRDIVSLGMINDLRITREAAGAKVSFTFELTTPACPMRNQMEQMARQAVSGVPGVAAVDVRMSASVRGGGQAVHGAGQAEALLPGVKHTIAVASGKGGVGKSTVATNLAVALAQTGAKVGLLDADVYGPSIPALMGIQQKPLFDGKQLIPVEAHGVRLMSLGFLMDDNSPVIWRGPLVASAVRQLLSDVDWGNLDYLLIDLPPGTGDAQLTLAQAIPLSGVVIVSTPQDVALRIATKALEMFQRLHVPILGLLENMSFFVCPNCGHEAHIFAHGGAELAAQRLRVPYLGAIPLHEAIRVTGDEGTPVVIAQPETAEAAAFVSAARNLAGQISIHAARAVPVLR